MADFTVKPRAKRYSTNVKSISCIKANAAEVLDGLKQDRSPMPITQNVNARAVLQDVKSYEETQDTLALLKLLALGRQDIDAGRTRLVAEVAEVAELRRNKHTRKAASAA